MVPHCQSLLMGDGQSSENTPHVTVNVEEDCNGGKELAQTQCKNVFAFYAIWVG